MSKKKHPLKVLILLEADVYFDKFEEIDDLVLRETEYLAEPKTAKGNVDIKKVVSYDALT